MTASTSWTPRYSVATRSTAVYERKKAQSWRTAATVCAVSRYRFARASLVSWSNALTWRGQMGLAGRRASI